MAKQPQAVYRRVLLKLSGEALKSDIAPVCPKTLARLHQDILALTRLGVEVAIVIGGGNWSRGRNLVQDGLTAYCADQMGMLFTLANGLAICDYFSAHDLPAKLFSSWLIPRVVDAYKREDVLAAFARGCVVVFGAGLGESGFTTDSAASLRAIEIGADIVLKATTVDGVYSEDPRKNPQAEKFTEIDYQTVIKKRLAVMDTAAFCLCEAANMPICIFDFSEPNALLNIVCGHNPGTMILK